MILALLHRGHANQGINPRECKEVADAIEGMVGDQTAKETCRDCGERTACDEDCPNYIEPPSPPAGGKPVEREKVCACGVMCQDHGLEGGCRYLRPERITLRKLVDIVYQHATESAGVPATHIADLLIDRAFGQSAPQETGKPVTKSAAGKETILDEILKADAAPPEAAFNNAKDMMNWLNDEPTAKSAPARRAPHNSGERLPSSDAAGAGAGTAAWREALERAEKYFELIRLKLINHLNEPERSAFWTAVEARNVMRSALAVPAPRTSEMTAEAPRLRAGAFFLTQGDKNNLRQPVGPLVENDDPEWYWKAQVHSSTWLWRADGTGQSASRNIVGDEIYSQSMPIPEDMTLAHNVRQAVIEECARVAEQQFAGTVTSNLGLLTAVAIRALLQPSGSRG